ncbi:MAG: Uncharacterized protein CEN91_149 [Candidatus Berkelbacteria bacterium Licking1014_85]|uniref:DUF218 domain-containing protein n=1 Tax=Candidatus Berkelbacteria bacterium Licking1014_85 TaxID=2017148 RepID=A0A554LLD2_9BACT|nr:MAG: Uncharacterized protein CEN91_149 [Candidatus Berkelbacteria bacterium Licking1014_85]
MILSRKPDFCADAVLFHSRGFNDNDGLFKLAASLVSDSFARYIVINGFEGERFDGKMGKTSPGALSYKKSLLAENVHQDKIIISEPAKNSREENKMFLKLAKENGWMNVIIISQPHQLLRLMLGALKEIKNRGMRIGLYSTAPNSTNWRKKVYASQGEKRDARFDDIQSEFKRISKYIKDGHLATLEELVEYLCIGIDKKSITP